MKASCGRRARRTPRPRRRHGEPKGWRQTIRQACAPRALPQSRGRTRREAPAPFSRASWAELLPTAPSRAVASHDIAPAGTSKARGAVGHREHELATTLDVDLDTLAISFEAQAQQASPPLHRKRHFGPSGEQMRIDCDAVLSRPEATRAEYCGLPEATQCAHVNAASGVAHIVGQVDLCSLAEIRLCKGLLAKPGGDKSVERGAQ